MKHPFRIADKRYTLLVIPEGTSPVYRMKVRTRFLTVGLLLLIGLIIALAWLALTSQQRVARIDSLQQQLSVSSKNYEIELSSRETAIEALQSELITLSEQAESVAEKMVELKQLESEMKSLVGLEDDIAEFEQTSDLEGRGGEELKVTAQGLESMLSDTKQRLNQTLDSIPDLQQQLIESMSDVREQQRILKITPSFWPTKSLRVTSVFGIRKDPFSGRPTFHSGLDIAGPTGDPVYAAADGTVLEAKYDRSRGYYIVLSHTSGMRTVYMHLRKYTVKEGDKIEQGDQIGLLGSTGRSTGPHLHFEVHKNGEALDPAIYLIQPGKERN